MGEIHHHLGVMFRREWRPESLPTFAQRAESAGLHELWVVEDLAYHGGFAQAAVALSATRRITVGLGIAPAVARNVGYAAMEVATLARLFPRRFHMGFGHGVDSWIAQVGATPTSWLTALREVTAATRALVAGDTLTVDGGHIHLDDVRLAHPALHAPLISLGVRGPKSMALAADVADGVIFAEWSGPRYVESIRKSLGDELRLTVFVQASRHPAELESTMQQKLSLDRFAQQLAAYGGTTPPLEEMAICGEPDTWAGQAQRWFDAGADAVVYCPLPADKEREVLP